MSHRPAFSTSFIPSCPQLPTRAPHNPCHPPLPRPLLLLPAPRPPPATMNSSVDHAAAERTGARDGDTALSKPVANYTSASPRLAASPAPARGNPYPLVAPYHDALLRVSKLHVVRYEVSGNPHGIPVCFIHGGPGGGTEPAHRQFFDPALYKIVLIDQRGCGGSLPFASLEQNTTWDLVNDMDAVREAAGIDRWMLFGGSWGSTLALAYAQEHPDRVIAMILRGIFLSRDKELRWLYERDGIAMLYPEAFNRYLNGLPHRLRGSESLMQAYHSILSKEEHTEERQVAANAWSAWEYTLSFFPRPREDGLDYHAVRSASIDRKGGGTVEGSGGGGDSGDNEGSAGAAESSLDVDPGDVKRNDHDNMAFARIESHFFVNRCFFDSDGMLLKEQRMARVRHIKTRIIQGRWDFVCPRKSAYDLAAMFDPSVVETYVVDNAGHSSFEPGIQTALLQATADFAHEFAHCSTGGGRNNG